MGKEIPKVVRSGEGLRLETPGGGYGKRMISSPVSGKMGVGILYVERGKSPHRWHTHGKMDKSGSYEIHYPKEFEEAYLIVQGEGVVQWKVSGKIYEEKIGTGDAVYFPPGIVEHQLLNNGDKPMTVVYAFAPPIKPRKSRA